MIEGASYIAQYQEVLRQSKITVTNIKPSEWAEKRIIMPSGGPFPGPWRYDRTPYTREIVDCLAPDHPARYVAVMKGGQIGFSSGVIMPGLGWIIENCPGNTMITVGSAELVAEAMEKVDYMLDNSGTRKLIKSNANRRRNNKSGDTNQRKEFPDGYVSIAVAGNHKAVRQRDLRYGFFDDIESVKMESKESGNTLKLWEQRFASYGNKKKVFFISTPEIKGASNIEIAYLSGDQRKYLIPCPCCGTMIELLWSIDVDGNTAGMTWKLDEFGRADPGSVGYICQHCAGFFNDKKKKTWLNDGIWSPTATPSRDGYFSYHISALYAAPGMDGWGHYVSNWIEANPAGQPRIESMIKVHYNVCLGLPHEAESEELSANALQKNVRNYDVGIVPDVLSVSDGNGKIIILTCSADMNGREDDARLDYEVCAWAENGAKYSLMHGSIGTFIPRENTLKHKVDRERWSYEENKPNSVWPEFEKLLGTEFKTESGSILKIACTGLDTGFFTTHAYSFIDKKNNNVVGLKGDKEDSNVLIGANTALVKPSLERRDTLFILQVGLLKDRLSQYMRLRWEEGQDQPSNFMNFPQPADGLYGFKNYFEHFEAEKRMIVTGKNGKGKAFRWEKKSSTVLNHMWDVAVYNLAVRDIFVKQFGKKNGMPSLTWAEFAKGMAQVL